MRYLILRRNIKILLVLFLFTVAFAAASPKLYKNIFVHDDAADYNATHYFSEKLQGPGIEDDILRYPDLIAQVSKGSDRDVSLDLDFLGDGYMASRLQIKDLNLQGVLVSTNIFIKGRFIGEKDGSFSFSGKLFSKDLFLNSYPFLPVSMAFRITKDELEIDSLSFGESYNLKGTLALKGPFKADFRLEVIRANIRDLAIIAKAKNPDIAYGAMNGLFKISGNLANLFSDGFVESKNGVVGPIGYDTATVKLEGFGPVMNIVDSNIKQGTGTITVDGYMDLRNLAKGNLFEGLRFKSDLKTIVWEDWDISKKGSDELSLTKRISDRVHVGFKTMAREPFTNYYDDENPEEMSLEYKMGTENLKMKLKDDEEFFGVEHSVKF